MSETYNILGNQDNQWEPNIAELKSKLNTVRSNDEYLSMNTTEH